MFCLFRVFRIALLCGFYNFCLMLSFFLTIFVVDLVDVFGLGVSFFFLFDSLLRRCPPFLSLLMNFAYFP